MVELMAAVVITATSLVMVYEVFTTCARALSDAAFTSSALFVLEERMAELRKASIEHDGVAPGASSGERTVGGRKISYAENIVEWVDEDEDEDEAEAPSPPEAGMGPDIILCEAGITASWQAHGKTKALSVKTYLPAEGYADEL